MTIDKAFKHLLNNWDKQEQDFKMKYRSYRSKHLNNSDYVGEGKMKEMLTGAGYKITIKVKAPK